MTDSAAAANAGILFEQLANLFTRLGVYASPSECHGLLCGLLAQGQELSVQKWLTYAAAYLERTEITESDGKTLLTRLYADSINQLQGTGFELDLVLPEDDADLEARVACVGFWCQGFLAGFGSQHTGQLSEEANDALLDLAEIARIERDELEDSEDNESDLVQIIEYVRMVAILIYSEIMGSSSDAGTHPSSRTLH